MSDWTLRAAMAYGVFGLLGFLSQMIVGLETRLLPLHHWYSTFAASGFQRPVPPLQAMGNGPLRNVVFVLWFFGVPTLALGFFKVNATAVAAAGWGLLIAIALSAFDAVTVTLGRKHPFARKRLISLSTESCRARIDRCESCRR